MSQLINSDSNAVQPLSNSNIQTNLEGLRALSAALAKTHHSAALAKTVVTQLSQNFGYELAVFYLLNSARTHLEAAALSWPALNKNSVSRLLSELQRQPITINAMLPGSFDPQQCKLPTIPSEYPQPAESLRAPVMDNRNVIGLIHIGGMEANCFSQKDKYIITIIADMCTQVLNKLQLLERQYTERKISDTLREISATLVSSLDLDNTLAIILDLLAQLLIFDSAAIYLLTPNNRLRMVAGTGMPNEEVTMASSKEIDRFILDEAVLDSKQAIAITDVRKDSRWTTLKGTEYIRSWLGIPLQFRDVSIGLVTVDRSGINPFTAGQITLAEAFAQHAAIAIENARLFSQVKKQQDRMRNLSNKVVNTQEEERRRISRELHDEMGQALTAIKLNLQMILPALPTNNADLIEQLNETIALTNHSLQEVRRLAMDLRPSILDDLGLAPTLHWYQSQFQKRNAVAFSLSIDEDLPRLAPEVETAIYRVVQEALTNVSRHAQAETVNILLALDDDVLRCTIADNGIGFEAAASNHYENMGVGLTSMMERIEALNGQIDINSKPGNGVNINIAIPIQIENGGS